MRARLFPPITCCGDNLGGSEVETVEARWILPRAGRPPGHSGCRPRRCRRLNESTPLRAGVLLMDGLDAWVDGGSGGDELEMKERPDHQTTSHWPTCLHMLLPTLRGKTLLGGGEVTRRALRRRGGNISGRQNERSALSHAPVLRLKYPPRPAQTDLGASSVCPCPSLAISLAHPLPPGDAAFLSKEAEARFLAVQTDPVPSPPLSPTPSTSLRHPLSVCIPLSHQNGTESYRCGRWP